MTRIAWLSSCCASSKGHVHALLALVLLQWLLLSFLLSQRHDSHLLVLRSNSLSNALQQSVVSSAQSVALHSSYDSSMHTVQQWEGVAIGLMLKRPRWFYKRYNIMIHNVMVNTPSNWAIQLFVNLDWFQNELLPYHRGLQRLVNYHDNPRLTITHLPPKLARLKPNAVLRDTWVWQHAVAEQILLFHGDGALCANTLKTWTDFKSYDYVGIPWGAFGGMGGAGTEFSLRKRSAVLAALEFASQNGVNNKNDKRVAEDRMVVSTLLKLNEKAGFEKYKVATPEVTDWFGGTDNLMGDNGTLEDVRTDWGPMVVSGTQAQLTDDARNWVIGVCPEIKGIFPSLHNPNCFGARPNQIKCAQSLGFALPCNDSARS